MAKRAGANRENREQTRALFLELATKEFNENGYLKASTARIVEESGMARGSLYYHFEDKEDLFRAVYTQTMENIAAKLAETIEKIDNPWDAFMCAAEEYFYVCVDPDESRIFLIESQTALPYGERHGVIGRTIRPVLTDTLRRLCEAGYFDGRHKEMLSIFIFGSLSEAGRIMNVLPNREKVMEHFFQTFRWAMEKMR